MLSKTRYKFKVSAFLLCLAATGLATSCKHRGQVSGVKVIGGVEDYDIAPAVVGLVMLKSGEPSGVCTGTIVRADLVLTAAHCVINGAPDEVVVFQKAGVPGQGLATVPHSIGIIGFPDYDPAQKGMRPNKDLAFVVFKPQTFAASPKASFSKTPAKIDQDVTLVGYGDTGIRDSDSNPQLKRFSGHNKVSNILSKYGSAIEILTSKVGFTTSGSGQGDSGGPLLDSQGEILGTAHVHAFDLPENKTKQSNDYISDDNLLRSVYCNIFNPGLAAFIAAVMADPNPTKATVKHIHATPFEDGSSRSSSRSSSSSPSSSSTELRCDGNRYCKDGWGWLTDGEQACDSSAPGWLAEKKGCSCQCG